MIVQERKLEEKKITKADAAKKIEAEKERDHELIPGVFRYLEYEGGTLRFQFKKYASDNFERYELVHGQHYQLPRMVIRHLNNNVHYIQYKSLAGDQKVSAALHDGRIDTNEIMQAKIKKPRCEFITLSFMDDDIAPSSIIEVSKKY